MIDDKFIHIHPNVGLFSRNRPLVKSDWWNFGEEVFDFKRI